jgi:hypothetical protein
MTANLPERVDVIERKLDVLSASVDKRFDAVDKRFDDVSAAFVEQRQYTEFAFDRLRREMLAGFERLEQRMVTREQFGRVERLSLATADQLGRLEQKLDQFIENFSMPKTRRLRTPKKR